MQEGQASRTADRVAERRAAHQVRDRPLVLDDPIALRIIRPEVAHELRTNPPKHETTKLGPYLRAFFVMRSRFAEDALASAVADGVRQYVVLGAGFDTFAYRNPFPELRVFEVDHPATQAIKRQRLAHSQIEIPSSLTFVPIDFTTTKLDDALRGAGFDETEPAFFSWLGVVPYLERPAIDATFQYIASLPEKTAVAFDYSVPPQSLSWTQRLVFNAMANRVAAIGEPWKTFFDPATLLADLRRLGFTSAEDFGADALNARYFADRTDKLRIGGMGHMAMASV
ncbi:MAG: class I SAM-dependent methyltransferase [Acidobacteria bacterium]|nr:class I SAM-dependent methyltransferase [Acidobacteriota bacterium]MBV9071536.1 class I SAM-dependent methyltransferase [Acidobacteriota bacterium]MBV9187017.1 class I SAM-dependent methyltransferase [Acidobacteriota bacterium]